MAALPRLTHRQVEVFRAVMTAGQFTRAAEALHTSQPTVSREMARLEQVLGLSLFERGRGGLRPTARAQALLEEVERAYIGLDHIAAAAVALRHFEHGRLSVACLPALAATLLPEAVRRFLAQHGQAGVALQPLDSPRLEHALSEQRVDLGLTERNEAPPGTHLQILLRADELAVLPAGHVLLRKRVLRPQDFEGEAFVSLDPVDPYRQAVDRMFAQAGVRRRLGVETGSAASVCALVREGLGLGIVNPLTALAAAGEGLQVRPLSVAIPFHVALVLPAWRAAHPLREDFVTALQAGARALARRLPQTPARRRPA